MVYLNVTNNLYGTLRIFIHVCMYLCNVDYYVEGGLFISVTLNRYLIKGGRLSLHRFNTNLVRWLDGSSLGSRAEAMNTNYVDAFCLMIFLINRFVDIPITTKILSI